MTMLYTENVLRKTIPKKEEFNRYWNGSGDRPVCLKTRISPTIAGYRDALAGFEDYIMSYAASPAYKERVVRPFIIEWIKRIADYFGEQVTESEDFFPHFIRTDKTVELLKLLQAREGISKSKLQEELGVGYKTVQNDLRALSPSLGKVDQELKIGGHVIRVDIKEKRLSDNSKEYHSPNTVNPLILFPNVMMTGKLLQSLAQDTESDVAQYIGADIWIQLTEYYMAQAFWFNEFKQYLNLVKNGYNTDEIKKTVIKENLFGAPNEYRAKRMYGYISNRVSVIEEDLAKIFYSSDLATQKLINLIAVIRKDRLFFEFLYEVYREKIIVGEETLALADGKTFFNHKESQDDSLAEWKDTTKRRVQSAYYNFMTEANLLRSEGKKNYIITPPLLDIALERYLQAHGEAAIVKAITGEY